MLVNKEAEELAAQLRAESPLVEGLMRGLSEIDNLIGGADRWDDGPICEGFAFAIGTMELDGDDVGVALIPLPDLSKRVYEEAHTADVAPGMVGRALSRVVLQIKAGGFTPDVAELMRDPHLVVSAVGFGAEAWSSARPDGAAEDYFRTRWIQDEPDRTELRFAMAVDFAGILHLHSRVRGSEPKYGTFRGRSKREVAGKIPQALDILLLTVRSTPTVTGN